MIGDHANRLLSKRDESDMGYVKNSQKHPILHRNSSAHYIPGCKKESGISSYKSKSIHKKIIPKKRGSRDSQTRKKKDEENVFLSRSVKQKEEIRKSLDKSTKAQKRRACNSLDMGQRASLKMSIAVPSNQYEEVRGSSPDGFSLNENRRTNLFGRNHRKGVQKKQQIRLKDQVDIYKEGDLLDEIKLDNHKKQGTKNRVHHEKDSATMTTMTLGSYPVYSEEANGGKKKIPLSVELSKQLADLFQRLEKEEGEGEDVKVVKKEIKEGFIIAPEGPKTTLHFYKILKLLGKGSFGKVYMASQVLTNRVVAIKCLEKKLVREESRRNKIMHELLMIKTLSGHPNITQIYEVFENKKYFFFVMEYASGGDLLQKMKQDGKLPEKEARGIFVQLLRGLKYIHGHKILHRDIKLDNILLTKIDGQIKAKICDFGVSRFISSDEIITEQCGTPAYIAPEIISKNGYSGYSADIWSLGVLLYAMVMGAMPFKAQNIDSLHLKIKERDCEMEDPEVSPEAIDLINSMLQVDPKKRISLSDIIEHEWLKDDPKLYTINITNHDFIAHPELYAVEKVTRFGFPEDFVRSSIKKYSLNHAFACYIALAKDFE